MMCVVDVLCGVLFVIGFVWYIWDVFVCVGIWFLVFWSFVQILMCVFGEVDLLGDLCMMWFLLFDLLFFVFGGFVLKVFVGEVVLFCVVLFCEGYDVIGVYLCLMFLLGESSLYRLML